MIKFENGKYFSYDMIGEFHSSGEWIHPRRSIKSYEEYKKTMHDFGKELGLTQKEIDSYIQKYGGMQDAAKKEIISKNVQKWGYDKKNSDTAIETFAKNLTSEER